MRADPKPDKQLFSFWMRSNPKIKGTVYGWVKLSDIARSGSFVTTEGSMITAFLSAHMSEEKTQAAIKLLKENPGQTIKVPDVHGQCDDGWSAEFIWATSEMVATQKFVFTRSRDRMHAGYILISEAELAERGVEFDVLALVGAQIIYNGVVHSVRGLGTRGLLIWKLGEKGPI